MPEAPPEHDVLLAYLHQNEIASSFHKSMLDMIGFDLSGPHRLAAWAQIKSGTLGLPAARNEACIKLLESDCEWLFFLDSDMGFKPETLSQLLEVADPTTRPIVGGLCFAWRELADDGLGGFMCEPRPVIMNWVKGDDGHERFTGTAHYPVNTLVTCGATGGACVLIHRSIIEQIQADYGNNWFTLTPDPSGNGMAGEDISFFMRVRESIGCPVHIHTGIRTSHFKSLWVTEDVYWGRNQAPPAGAKIDVIVPVLSRPQNVKPLVDSLRASTGLANVYFVGEYDYDTDDGAESRAVDEADAGWISDPDCHTFAEKVNLAYDYLEHEGPGTDAEWVLICGDDVIFHAGWWDQAYQVYTRYGSEVIGTNDMLNPRVVRGEHATHIVIKKSYIEEHGASWGPVGQVCSEEYTHCFVDDEIVTKAKQLKTFQPALGSFVEHRHPLGGKVEVDEVYQKGQQSFAKDKKTFEDRLRRSATRKVLDR